MRTLLLIGLSLLTSVAQALEIIPLKGPSGYGVKIKDITYPDKIEKELSSGLTTKVLYHLQLKAGPEVIINFISEYAVKYDLWDESFAFEISPPSDEKVKRIFRSNNEVLVQLQSPVFDGAFGSDVQQDKLMRIQVDILLNPIQKEKMEKIRKWVAQNSVTDLLDPTGGRSLKSTGARGDTIFNTIFEQFSRGSSVAGVWKTSGQSKEFRFKEVNNEK